MRRVIVIVGFVLGVMGCDGGDGPETPPEAPPSRQADFPQPAFNAVTGESPRYQATQVLSPLSQQNVTSRRYVMTVSMF